MLWMQLILLLLGLASRVLAEDFRDELYEPQQETMFAEGHLELSPRLSIVLTDFDQRDQQRIADSFAPGQGAMKRLSLKGKSIASKLVELKSNNLTSVLPDLGQVDSLDDRTGERWKLVKLNQLLESVSSAIPTSAPPTLRRSSRTYPSSTGVGVSIMETPRLSSGRPMTLRGRTLRTMSKAELEQQLDRNISAKKPALMGIVWQPTGSLGASPTRVQAKSALGLDTSDQDKLLTSGEQAKNEEMSMDSPMHSQVGSDFQFKRVENSRWNNLRGMWGKRSVPMDSYMESYAASDGKIGANSNGRPAASTNPQTSSA